MVHKEVQLLPTGDCFSKSHLILRMVNICYFFIYTNILFSFLGVLFLHSISPPILHRDIKVAIPLVSFYFASPIFSFSIYLCGTSISQNLQKIVPIATFAEITKRATPRHFDWRAAHFLRFLRILRNRPSSF